MRFVVGFVACNWMCKVSADTVPATDEAETGADSAEIAGSVKEVAEGAD